MVHFDQLLQKVQNGKEICIGLFSCFPNLPADGGNSIEILTSEAQNNHTDLKMKAEGFLLAPLGQDFQIR